MRTCTCKCNVPFHVHNSYVHNYHPYLKHKVYNDLHLYDIILECHSKFLSCPILATLIRNVHVIGAKQCMYMW